MRSDHRTEAGQLWRDIETDRAQDDEAEKDGGLPAGIVEAGKACVGGKPLTTHSGRDSGESRSEA